MREAEYDEILNESRRCLEVGGGGFKKYGKSSQVMYRSEATFLMRQNVTLPV